MTRSATLARWLLYQVAESDERRLELSGYSRCVRAVGGITEMHVTWFCPAGEIERPYLAGGAVLTGSGI